MSKSIFRKKSVAKILHDVECGFSDSEHPGTASSQLKKELNVKDLTLMGIAAVVGAGIFSTIGEASFHGGPAVSLLFVVTAITCGFSALCYAEFASRIPVAGSAYTYAYASFGELIAWIIGWDLLMEYAIGNIAVAISWSEYFVNLLEGFNIHLPKYLTMDYVSALRGHDAVLAAGSNLADISDRVKGAAMAWDNAPGIGGFKLIANLPALGIVFIITYLVYIGIRETKKATNAMVILKIVIVIAVIVVGFFYVTPANWHPFMPNGFGGVMKGVSGVFFAYIGFDAISTTAEECEQPQRDLPRGMIYSLIICTVLYVLLALVLTGMVHYTKLNVGDPLSLIFEARGLKWISGIVAISAIIATASVLLIFQLGQPRIWMSMSRDGLLPSIFAKLHPVYKTPSFSTILTGCLVAIPALFLNLDVVLALTSIGTLFAFVLVCGGVLVLQKQNHTATSKFKVPYVNGKFIIPVLFIISVILVATYSPAHFVNIFSKEGFPMLLFWIVAAIVSIFSFKNSFSLIPVLGLVSCFYLMAQESHTNWLRFLIWLAIGLVVYFSYGIRKSKLALNTA